MNPPDRLAMIRSRIESSLRPSVLDVADESHLHKGHAGARDGRGHFRVRVVAEDFNGLTPLQRHRIVYAALGELMNTDIHALAITALTPAENARPSGT